MLLGPRSADPSIRVEWESWGDGHMTWQVVGGDSWPSGFSEGTEETVAEWRGRVGRSVLFGK